jgi:hypothetical protein
MSNDTTPRKGIHALIYRDALGIDFSNRGISARVTEVTAVGPGIDPIFAPTQERPAVCIVRRENPGGTIYHAEPLPTEDEPAPWYMFGGAFIFSSDSRFHESIDFYGAVPLHDRRE